MPQVEPDGDEEGEVGDGEGGVDVVECFGGLRGVGVSKVGWAGWRDDLRGLGVERQGPKGWKGRDSLPRGRNRRYHA